MDTVKQMQRELEEDSCSAFELPSLTAAAASRHSSSVGGAAAAVTAAAARLKRGHPPPPATAATSSSTVARFPGDAPPASLIGLDADSNAVMEALYPTHNRYVRQQLPDVKATKSNSNPFAKRLLPSKSGRVITTMSPLPQPGGQQKLEDGFLADAINR